MTVSPRDADVIREALGYVPHTYVTAESGPTETLTERVRAARAERAQIAVDSLDALDRLVARVHALERALGEIERRSTGQYTPNDLVGLRLRLAGIADVAGECLALRAVVLEGAARQEQTQDLGGLASKPRGTEQESQP